MAYGDYGCYSGSFHIQSKRTKHATTPPTDPRLIELTQWLRKTRAVDASRSMCGCWTTKFAAFSDGDKVRLIAAINEWGFTTTPPGMDVQFGPFGGRCHRKAGKLLVVQDACHRLGLNSLTRVLRIGDGGDFGGNDYELLSEGLALSVDAAPRC